MGRSYFRFKQFLIKQESAAMKVGTDGVLLGAWVDVDNVNSALDIGTGSGVIALMIAQRSNAKIHAVEIDEASALQAKHNFEESPWGTRITIDHLSLQAFASASNSKFDLIVSNPPYFNKSLKSPSAERTLTRHTDELPNSDLLNGVKTLLAPEGRFCAIFPYTEGNILIAEAVNYGLYCNRKLFVQTKPDKPIIRILTEFSFHKKRLPDSTISIHTANGDYTDEYKQLTADFYLAF